MQYDIFKEYEQAFDKNKTVKDLKKSSVFKNKTATEQDAELDWLFIAYLHTIEKDKLYYFILAHKQAGKVLIVSAPSNEKEQKQFLGYEWSGAKGNEGIQYEEGDTVNDITTPLFDPKDLDNSEKINTAIKRNFIGETTDSLPEYCRYAKLTDMLDFTRIDFNKVINLNPKQNTDIETQWELVKLGEVVEVRNGGTPNTKNPDYWNGGDICWATLVDTKNKYLYDTERKITQEGLNNSSAVLLPMNTVIFSSRATIGDVSIAKVPTATNQGYKNFICNPDVLHYEYLYYVLKFYAKEIATLAVGMTYKEISSTNIKNYQIPLLPLEVQQQIVNECEAVDQETDQARQTVTSAKHQIEAKVQSVINAGYEMKNIDRVLTLEYGISLTEKERISGDFPVYGSNGVVGSHNEFLVKAPGIIVGRKGSAGEINWSDKSCTPIDTTFYVKLLDETATDLKFTYHMLKSLNLPSLKVGSGPGGINRNNVYGLQIPMPPLNVQQQLVVEVKQLESEITKAQAVIDNATERKNAILTNYLMKIDSQNR